MEDAGQRLKKRREELNLRYRDVEEASQQIASRRANDEFSIALSRLADIENKGIVPSIYRIYSLCAIYRLDVLEVLEWYGIDVSQLPADASMIDIGRTHVIGFHSSGNALIQLPLSLDPGVDLRRTTYLSRMIQRWGKLPLMLLDALDLKGHRYAYVGSEDWSMYPLIQPGSLVLIDETKRKIVNGGWAHEHDRPIYFLEHRSGYVLGWCNLNDDRLVVSPHPASEYSPEIYGYPQEIDIVGQVTGVAMRIMDSTKRRRGKA
jgi:transcriptional regulator with XRE-family HTH domain